MDREIEHVIRNIENNISHCDILNRLLNEINSSGSINYYDFYNKGYKKDEIYLGAELIDLYIMLKKYIEQMEDCKETCV